MYCIQCHWVILCTILVNVSRGTRSESFYASIVPICTTALQQIIYSLLCACMFCLRRSSTVAARPLHGDPGGLLLERSRCPIGLFHARGHQLLLYMLFIDLSPSLAAVLYLLCLICEPFLCWLLVVPAGCS